MTVNPGRTLILVALLGVCAPGSLIGQLQVRHDASVEVQTMRPAANSLLSIGEAGGPEYEFFRVSDAFALRDGRVVVLNSGTEEVRVFSSDGTFIESFGGAGQGPGEFSNATRMFLSIGDSIIVWDDGNVRASVLTADDGFIRTIPLQPMPQAPRLVGVTEAGGLLIAAMHFDQIGGGGEISRIPESLFSYSSLGSRVGSLGRSPGMAGVIRGADDRVEILRPLVAPTTTYGVGGGTLWVETGDFHGVEAVDLDSGVRRAITWDGPELAMTDDYVDAIINERVRAIADPEARRRMRASYEARPVPETIPATVRVVADGTGRGWVELAPVPDRPGDAQWLVLSPEGELLLRVAIPRRMTLLSVMGEEIIVVERDEFDIEYVRLYRLVFSE